MNKIDLQSKTKALNGYVTSYWFENKEIGLERTLFHKISIPLEKFDSGLSWVSQPEDTSLEFDWYNLGLDDASKLNGLNLDCENYPSAEGSVYIGSAHNWCIPKKLKFELIHENVYKVFGEILIEFEEEGIGLNEEFTFEVNVTYSSTGK